MNEAKGIRPSLPWVALASALVLIVSLTPTALAQSQSSDAILSGLTLSNVDFGTFASGTTSYTANVANRVKETTVTPTANHSGAKYVVKLDGVEDSDGVVSLSVGSNTIAIEVTAEDEETTQTYTVTVTRAENTPATGKPTMSGTAEVGGKLTVSFSGIADEDGIDLDGNWFNGTYEIYFISSCAGHMDTVLLYYEPSHSLYESSLRFQYTVPWKAAGSSIMARVMFADEGGDQEVLYSDPSAVIPGPIEGLVLVDTSDQTELETMDCEEFLDDTPEIVLDANGTYTFRVELADDADVGSVSWDRDNGGFTRTDDASPFTLYGEDGDGNLSGRGFSAGTHFVKATAYSADSEKVQNPSLAFVVRHDTPATGAPTISGTAQVGQTLTASTSGISDSDGLTSVAYSYQWLVDDTEIDGATSSTYTVQSSDNGKVIKVRVTFRDDAGTRESLTSDGTSAVVMGGL